MTNARSWWFVMVVALVGCGGSGGGAGDDDDAPSTDAPRPDAPATTAAKTGSLLIQEATLFGNPLTLIGGSFRDGKPTGAVERVDGPCVIANGALTQPPAVGAGTLTITNGADVLSIVPDASNSYFANQQGLRYPGGAALTVAVTGATVPAFSQPITFPTGITVTSPSGVPATVNKSGFSIAWSGAGPVLVLLGQRDTRIRCAFDGVTSATLPASTLSDLIAGTTDDDQISIVVAGAASTALEAGDFAIEILAMNAGFSGIGFAQ